MPQMNILKHIHPMVMVDFHDEISPPGVPAPKIPHFVCGMLCIPPWGVVTGKPNMDVIGDYGMTLGRGTDMGFFIPHIPIPPAPANLLYPVLFAFSGSKSHFGAHASVTPKGPVAFACLVEIGLNLNCAGPTVPPHPGFVISCFMTSKIEASWGDIIAGAIHMAVDCLIQFLMNRAFRFIGNWVNAKIAGALANRVSVMGVRLATIGGGIDGIGAIIQAVTAGSRGGRLLGYGLEQLPGILAGLGTGTPVGYSPGQQDVGWDSPMGQAGSWMDKKEDALAQSIDDMFNSPSVEQHPSTSPPDAGGGDAGGVPSDGGAPDAGGSDAGAGGGGGSGGAPGGGGGDSGGTSSDPDSGGVCGPDEDG